MPRDLASAAPATWDGEPEPSFSEPVSVRPYFSNRDLYRTRGTKLALSVRLKTGPRCNCRPRSREWTPRRTCRGVVRRRGPPSSDDPSEPDLAGPCPLRGLDVLAVPA